MENGSGTTITNTPRDHICPVCGVRLADGEPRYRLERDFHVACFERTAPGSY